MTRKSRGSPLGRKQRFMNISSLSGGVAQGTTSFLPTGARIVAIRGANSGADTFSFRVTVTVWELDTSSAKAQSITYTNLPNGARCPVMKDFPFITSTGAAPAAAGGLSISITAGADTSLEVYYSTLSPLIDLPTPVLPQSPGTSDSSSSGAEIPLAVKQWLKSC